VVREELSGICVYLAIAGKDTVGDLILLRKYRKILVVGCCVQCTAKVRLNLCR